VLLPDQLIVDESGSVISSAPPVLHEPSTWGDWPAVIGSRE
jgi:hypothetical protein